MTQIISFKNMKKRLNKKGRAFYAGKMYMQGLTTFEISPALEVERERVPTLIGKCIGFFGGYDGNEGKHWTEIVDMLTDSERKSMITKIEIAIQAHGDKLFTTEPLPVKKLDK